MCTTLFRFYFAGIIYDTMKTYTIAFICAGIPPLVGALLMCFIYRAKTDSDHTDQLVEDGMNNGAEEELCEDVGRRNNPIIKVYTPNGHSYNNTPTISSGTDQNCGIYSNLKTTANRDMESSASSYQREECSDVVETQTDVSENESLMRNAKLL